MVQKSTDYFKLPECLVAKSRQEMTRERRVGGATVRGKTEGLGENSVFVVLCSQTVTSQDMPQPLRDEN